MREIKSIREVFEVTVALSGANQLTSTLVAKDKKADDEAITNYIAEQSSRESAPHWLKDAIGQLETAARIAEPARESAMDADREIEAEVKHQLRAPSEAEHEALKSRVRGLEQLINESLGVDGLASKTDISTRPDFSQKLGVIDETVGAEPQDFAAVQKKIWAGVMKTAGSADTSQEASPDGWRSQFSGMVDMSKYTAKLHAEKAAKRQAELDRMAETRRAAGIRVDWES